MTAVTVRAVAAHHERRAITAESVVAAVSALHQPENRRCVECEVKWPCRTARLLGKS